MGKIAKLMALCNGGISININENRSYHEDVAQSLVGLDDVDGVKKDIKEEMIKRNIMINVVFYPDTVIGFYSVWHYDLDKALDECLNLIENEIK